MTFAILPAALVSGAIADRAKSSAWMVFVPIWVVLVYSVVVWEPLHRQLGAVVVGLAAGIVCSFAIGLKFRFGYDDSLDVVGSACSTTNRPAGTPPRTPDRRPRPSVGRAASPVLTGLESNHDRPGRRRRKRLRRS